MDFHRPTDLLCFSHLRWDFVFQRPNHLMSRAAQNRRVLFVEEPISGDSDRLSMSSRGGVTIVTPVLAGAGGPDVEARLAALVDGLVKGHGMEAPVLWYETPMALPWTRHLAASAVVYDCMDELAGFDAAPRGLLTLESELIARADLVFTGGRSLYEAKRALHPSVHAFPSSVDAAHFRQARDISVEPAAQASIARPRLGWFGVIDERMDLDLVRDVAAIRPDWQIVLVGPVAKIDPARLPSAENVHPLGARTYAELPGYLAGWDVAIMPFARNRATRYISPTKTPEYLAGGKPVVSTSIEDVIDPYRDLGLVRIADSADAFVAACEAAMAEPAVERIQRADAFLAGFSWDETWRGMAALIQSVSASRRPAGQPVREWLPLPPAPTAAGAVASPSLPSTTSVSAVRGALE